ncbi:phosphate signaling complex protein PhoU [Natronospira bacteriovora]|uniref:Phosphate-specific transport system accessory protein PhoU n=1 Tax=Natronospira bacteriovora TaxID=3069753 RepID=A0ABU0W2X0_9GAMM|nr:phosphate signaling complex protein PhoU [Natronospira sp. AB-CW4]MDQ2068362.1 phosphate signaling complex protein PhoU [Natronospira sp. AB-CW4]
MDKLNLNQHISRQFNRELEDVRNRVLAMGGLVERQIGDAVRSLVENDITLAEEVIEADRQINDMEKEIDEECNLILARRQPAASDLRLVLSIVKTITDLERIGDEAERIARLAIRLAESDRPSKAYREVEHLGRHVRSMVREALDGFARLAPEVALKVAREDEVVDAEYDAIMRQNITYMMEDPRNVRRTLDMSFVARSLERIGDHAKNIGEYIIYLVEGKDLRHAPIEEMEKEIGESAPREQG